MRVAPVLGLSLAIAGASSAQDAPKDPAATPSDSKHSGAPIAQFKLGPLIVTPTFRVGNLALDTNVQYQRQRRADFLAAAGPGLDIALPFLDRFKLDIQGESQYFYFHRTKNLRRWTGGGAASIFWASTGTRASLSARMQSDFSRPSFEVDARVASRQGSVMGNLERDLGRLTLVLRATVSSTKVGSGQEFRGADLATALTANQFLVAPQFRYRLTPISSLIFDGFFDLSRFPNASDRNFHQEGAGMGIQTAGFFKGQVTAGFRRNRLDNRRASKSQPYLRGNLSQRLGRRVRLGETYTHDSSISAFAADGSLPTFEHRSLSVDLSIDLTRRIDLRLRGVQEKLKSDGLVNLVLDSGAKATAMRDDLVYLGAGDLGIRLGRARVGLFTSYTTRKSLFFSDFGIKGLQAGARVEYSPM